MTELRFVPIPNQKDALRRSSQHWLPFLEHISKRSKEPLDDLLDMVIRNEVQPVLAWDGEKAHALAGIRTVKRGEDVIGEIVWLTGRGMKEWTHLLPDMEQYLRDIGCTEIKPICRPGWSRLLKKSGYRVTHYTMEKRL